MEDRTFKLEEWIYNSDNKKEVIRMHGNGKKKVRLTDEQYKARREEYLKIKTESRKAFFASRKEQRNDEFNSN